MATWIQVGLGVVLVLILIIGYFTRLEIKLAKIMTDLSWIKKVLDSRSKPRKEIKG